MKQFVKWFFLAFIVLSVFFSCTQIRKNTIIGTIEGLKSGDKVSLVTYHNSKSKFIIDDSTVVKKDGRFTLKTATKNEMARLFVVPQGDTTDITSASHIQQGLSIFLEGLGKYTITGSVENFPKSQIQGGVYQLPEYIRLTEIEDQISSIRDHISALYRQEPRDTNLINTATAQFDSLRAQTPIAQKSFITQYPDNTYSAYIIYTTVRNEIPLDTLCATFDLLGEKSKASIYGKNTSKWISDSRASSVGQPAPDFNLTSLSGDTLSVSSFKGKYLVLEFWASWCTPCRANNPHLVELYNKYHPQGLEILGIGIWDQDKAWKKAIEQDSLPWHHVNADEKVKGQAHLADTYVITGVPSSLLISREGKILFRGHPARLTAEIEAIFDKSK